MKKSLKLLSLVLALGLILGSVVTANAKEVTKVNAANASEIESAVSTARAAGKDLEITLTANVNDPVSITVDEGQTVTVNGANYTMDSLVLAGKGSVVVTVKTIKAQANRCSLFAAEDVQAKITADISRVDLEIEYSYVSTFNIVYVTDRAVVEINGNISAGTEKGENLISGNAVNADSNASVTVNGNVTAGTAISLNPENCYADAGDGIYAEDSATVKVVGNVTGGVSNGRYTYAPEGVEACNNATVEVIGNVIGGYATNVMLNSYNSSELIYAKGNGIYVYSISGESSSVKVTGNVTGGKAPNGTSLGGCGIYVDDVQASVTVLGDVTGGDGAGIKLQNSSTISIYVDGTVSGSKGEVAIEYDTENDDEIGMLPDFSTFPKWEDVKSSGVNYMQYLDFMMNSVASLAQVGYIPQKQYEKFFYLVVAAYLDTVNVELPDPFDINNPIHQTILTEGLKKVEELNETQTGVTAFLTALESHNEELYGAFNTIIDSIDTVAITAGPNVTVWKLTPNDDGDFTNKIGFLSQVNYLIRISDSVGGTVSATRKAMKKTDMTIFTVTPNKGYKFESFAVTNCAVSGGKVSWNSYLTDYEGGLIATASFKSLTSGTPGAPSVTPPAGETNPPTADSNTMVFAAMATMTLAVGFCLFNLIRIRKNEQ